MRFNVATQSFETPVQMPNTGALAGSLGISATDVWITDFNNDVVWRYRIRPGSSRRSRSRPGRRRRGRGRQRLFTQPGDVNAPGTSNIGRIDAATGTVTLTPTTDGSVTVAPRDITVASDGQVWFTARFTPQAVGRLNPSNNSVTLFPVANTGPAGIAASPDGSVWFTQEIKGQRRQDHQRRGHHRRQGGQGQRPVRDRRRSQRRPLVHHDGREQDRHAAAALESGSESPFGLSGMTEAPLTRGFRSSSRRWAIPQPSCRGWARMLVDGVLHVINEHAVAHARRLIDARQYVLRSVWNEVQPSASAENGFLESHSWSEYSARTWGSPRARPMRPRPDMRSCTETSGVSIEWD